MLKSNKKILKIFKQKKKAFTLLEIVVALGIVGVMIMTLGGALVTSVKANKMGEIKQESKLISQEIIEKLRSLGDVKDGVTLAVGKNQSDNVKITKVIPEPIDSITGKKINTYKVEGTLTDSENKVMVTGHITEKSGIKEDYGSLNYLNKKFGLLVVIENEKNKISLYKGNKTIDEHLGTIAIKTFENSKELKIEVGNGRNKFITTVNGENIGTIDLGEEPSKSFIDIGIYVKDQRVNSDLVNLYLSNKNLNENEAIGIYFFNNKFHGLDYTIGDPITDSFKEDRYINGEFSIYDNITYYPKSERLNKGLYTIDLEFNKKVPSGSTVTEKTRSEFMVDN